MSAIKLDRVVKSWGSARAVDGVSLEAEEGSLLVLLGPSGCGKSTTLRLIAGLEQPDSGTVMIGGADVTHLTPAQRRIAMVFQSYALFPHLSVAENIVFGLRVRRVSRAERDARLKRVSRTSWALRSCSTASHRNYPAASVSGSRSAARSSPRRACA